jgi:hypothetical protein
VRTHKQNRALNISVDSTQELTLTSTWFRSLDCTNGWGWYITLLPARIETKKKFKKVCHLPFRKLKVQCTNTYTRAYACTKKDRCLLNTRRIIGRMILIKSSRVPYCRQTDCQIEMQSVVLDTPRLNTVDS